MPESNLPDKTKPSSQLPSLDGWRAVSIILVLGEHCTRAVGFPTAQIAVVRQIFDGNLGVRFFFVISGFLITWLMVGEHDRNGRVSLRRFYARRALRILPVHLAFLGVLAIICLLTPFKQSAVVWAGNLTFTTNYVNTPQPSGHLWSLAVEEQFYLVWPSVFLLFGAADKLRSVLIALAAGVVIAPLWRFLAYEHFYPSWLSVCFAFDSFFNYSDSLAVGCACAILLARKRDWLQRCLQTRPRLVTVLALLLIIIPKLPFPAPLIVKFMSGFGNDMQAAGFAVLLLKSVLSPQAGLFRVLNWPWVRRIGVLSYSIYIWQQIFCADPRVFGLGPVWWMTYPGWLVPVFLVACVSYYGLERPLVKLRSRLRPA